MAEKLFERKITLRYNSAQINNMSSKQPKKQAPSGRNVNSKNVYHHLISSVGAEQNTFLPSGNKSTADFDKRLNQGLVYLLMPWPQTRGGQ